MKDSRETFAGQRIAPELWGLERAALYPIAGSWTAAGMFATVFHQRMDLPWIPALLATAVPAAIVTFGALTLVQGKPPGYLMNWLEEYLWAERHCIPRKRVPPHPLNDPRD